MTVLNDSLLYSIVREGDAERFVRIARQNGAGGATVLLAGGTASNAILRALGLGNKTREIVLVVTDNETARKIIDGAVEDSRIEGVSILVPASGEKVMKAEMKMITVIVNSGYAEDVMAAARKAGATGGTVAHARGTAPNDGSDKFFGVVVVPEKDMVTIVVQTGIAEAVVNEIQNLECLQKPGTGVMYTQDVREFINLGSRKV